MLAYLRAATLLARALDAVVVADAGAPAYLAHAPFAVMLAYRRPAALFAIALDTVVVADAGAPAVLAPALLTIVGALLPRRRRHCDFSAQFTSPVLRSPWKAPLLSQQWMC